MSESFVQLTSDAAKAFWSELPLGIRLSGKAIVYAPIFTKSLAVGLAFPDLDLVTAGIGIGGHRWAVTHSALGAWIAKRGIQTLNEYVSNDTARQILKEATAVAGVGFSIGISAHLLKDCFIDAEQSVRFKVPFLGGPGTALGGTYLDDDLWLGANGFYALKLAGDMLALGFGDDAIQVRNAFHAWLEQRSTVDAVNAARTQAMRESRELSNQIENQLGSGIEGARYPRWLGG